MNGAIAQLMIGKTYKGHRIMEIRPAVGGRHEIIFEGRNSLAVRDLDDFYAHRVAERIINSPTDQPSNNIIGEHHENV